MKTYRDLIVWKRAFDLCLDIYKATDSLPAHERYGLTSELRKTVRSVLYNIAEGHRRCSTLEFLRFLDISRGSASELETQLLLARALNYFDSERAEPLLRELDEIERMLAGLRQRLKTRARR